MLVLGLLAHIYASINIILTYGLYIYMYKYNFDVAEKRWDICFLQAPPLLAVLGLCRELTIYPYCYILWLTIYPVDGVLQQPNRSDPQQNKEERTVLLSGTTVYWPESISCWTSCDKTVSNAPWNKGRRAQLWRTTEYEPASRPRRNNHSLGETCQMRNIGGRALQLGTNLQSSRAKAPQSGVQ